MRKLMTAVLFLAASTLFCRGQSLVPLPELYFSAPGDAVVTRHYTAEGDFVGESQTLPNPLPNRLQPRIVVPEPLMPCCYDYNANKMR